MKYSNRSAPSKARLAALLAAGLAIGAAQNVMAAGTASGTSISNTATLSYAVGGVPQTDIPTTSASFVVDNKVNLTVAEVGGSLTTSGVVPGATGVVTTFSVTNNGNTVQDYALSVNNAIASGQTLFGSTDNFDVTACSAFVESGANVGYQSGEDTATFIDELGDDDTATVHVVCSVPNTRVNNDVSLVSLTATTHTGGAAGLGALTAQDSGVDDPAVVQVVFADVAGSDDAARNGAHSARDGYLVTSAIIAVSKTYTLLCDPFNGVTNPKNIPGAMVRWTIQVSNTGATSATLSTITDTLNAATAHDANLVAPTNAATCSSATGTPESLAGRGFQIEYSNAARALGGTGGYMTGSANADGATIAGQAVTIDFAAALPVDAGDGYAAGELKAGETATVTFNVTVQ